MTPTYMLDTDTCVYIARGKDRRLEARLTQTATGDIAVSAVTYGELAYGAAKSKWSDLAEQNLNALVINTRILPIDDKVAAAYGKLRADLERQGRIIGNNDLWIGAHALSLGLTLVTNNEREFRRIEGLSVENWSKPAHSARSRIR
jgi:tRNA(fMet)-specific endonuclease VapC